MQCLFEFLGCSFSGNSLEIETHLEESVKYHFLLVGKFLSGRMHKQNGVANKDYGVVKQILHAEMEKARKRLETINDNHKENPLKITRMQSEQNDISFRLTGIEDLLTSL